MNYSQVLTAAAKTVNLSGALLSTKLPPPKKLKKEKKGVESAAVRAFLEKREKEDREKALKAKEKRLELTKKRVEGNTQKTANAMASRTKDNLKVLRDEDIDVTVKPEDHSKKSSRTAHSVSTDWLRKREAILEKMRKDKEDEKKARSLVEHRPKPEQKDKPKRSMDVERYTTSKDSKSSHSHSSGEKSHKHSSSDKGDRHRHKKHKHKHKHSSRERDIDLGNTPWVSVKHKVKDATSGLKKHKHKSSSSQKKAGPPPMSFQDLLKLAQLKETNPNAVLEVPGAPKPPPPKKPEKEVRPMTQDEKEREVRKKSKEYKHWLKFGGKMPALSGDASPPHPSSSSASSSSKHKPQRPEALSRPGKPDHTGATPHKPPHPPGNHHKPHPGGSHGNHSNNGRPAPVFDKAKALAKLKTVGDIRFKGGAVKSESGRPGEKRDNLLVCKREREVEEEEEVPRKVKAREPEPQVSTWDRLYGQFHQKKAKPAPKRPNVIDSESEYDSDMDDFIDDGDGVDDYSSAIRDIFGYDKRKYQYEEDDVDDMEAGFADVEKEEAVSARLGYLEDLEDIKKEEEEKKQKMMRMKMMKKRR